MEVVAGCSQSATETKSKPDKRLSDSWFGSVTAVLEAAKNGQEFLVSCVNENQLLEVSKDGDRRGDEDLSFGS